MIKQTVTELLHEWMHDLPGMPEHSQSERLNHRGGLEGGHPTLQNRPLKNPNAHHEDEPRVLVEWQRAIARLFTRRGR